jgi:hypothetical protein
MGLGPGVRLGAYEVVAPLGAGGMGEVYRARDTRIGRDVAVKVLPPGLAQDTDRLKRFELEARAAGQLNHPNVIVLYDVGRHDGAPYVVSELLEGQTLRERLGGAALHVRKTIEVGVQIARGLAAAHDKGIVHRDLKPDNVFVTKDGQVKILDFGLAKLTHPELAQRQDSELQTATRGTDPGTVLGTVGYMSPEQVRGRHVDHRSDIFSLGAILYEMLSGRRAFSGETSVETLNAILREEPPELTTTNKLLPPALDRIVRHCLEKNPDERFASARDLAFDLQALSETSSEARVIAPAGRRRLFTAGLALVIAWLATGVGSFVLGRRTATPRLPSFRLLTFRRGAVENARFAPDGHSVFYNAQWGASWKTYAASLDSPEPRVLEPGGKVVGAATGEVAIIAKDSAHSVLLRVPVSGGAPREVARDVMTADWARTGEFALVREEGGRQRIEFPPGRVIYETPNEVTHVRVSSDVTRVAVIEQLRGYSEAHLRVVDASGAPVLTSGPWGGIDSIAWSPDGREVWISAQEEVGQRIALQAVALDGAERLVYRGADPLHVNDVRPDGRMLVVSGLYRMEMRGRAPGASVETDLTWLGRSFVCDLSADGRTVLFEDGEFAKGRAFMFLGRTDGSAPIQLGQGTPAGLSPDGRWALGFPSTTGAEFQRTLAVIPTAAGESRVLPRGTIDRYLDAFWFTDGRRVLIVGHAKDKPARLFEQDVESGEPKPVTPEGVASHHPTLVPDGRGALAANLEAGSVFRLYSFDGAEPKEVPGIRDGDSPLRFDAAGRYAFVREPSGADEPRALIARVDTLTGQREPWLDLRPADPLGAAPISMVRLSGDGRSYAYTFPRLASNLFLVEGLR